MKKILNNYKTSFPAFLAVIAVSIYWCDWITTQQFMGGIGLLTAAGLFGARDYDNNAK